MKSTHPLLTFAVCLALVPATLAAPPPEPVPPHMHAAMSNNTFAFDLYAELAKDSEAGENLFFSPLSITAALSLTYEGARGDTESQLFETLRIGDGVTREGYHRSLSELLGTLDGDKKPYELAIANSLWGEQSIPFREDFLETLGNHYDAGFNAVDFIRSPEDQRKAINRWVEDKTEDRVKDLLPHGSIETDTRLVLANAIYFKGSWIHQFTERLTKDRPFHLIGADEPLQTPTMLLRNEPMRFADLDGLDVLEMRFKGGDVSMVILLPDERDGIEKLEAQLSGKQLGQWVSQLKYGAVHVTLPKWEATVPTDVVPALKRLGLTDAFDDKKADFTGVTDSAEGEDFYLSGVFHKAFIKVDEEGCEAAAATAGVMFGATSAPPAQPFAFTVDRPFVYLIRDTRSGAVLFLGRMADPS